MAEIYLPNFLRKRRITQADFRDAIGAPDASNTVTTDTTQTITGAKTFDANQFIGTNTDARILTMNGPAGSARNIFYKSANVNRWVHGVTLDAESGANAGSDFLLFRYADDGSSIGQVLRVRRSTGAVQAGLAPTGGYQGADVWNFAAVPQVNADPVVTETGTQTLTNKTLSSPAVTGTVSGDTGAKIRLANQGDVSPISTAHAFQIGPDAGVNIAMDGNEIMARNNGVASTLHLNVEGGAVSVGAGGLSTSGNLSATGNVSAGGTITKGGVTVATLSGAETLTNKTIDLTNNTLTTTLAELNAAISDATLANIPSGTRMLFQQTTAPTGWTKDVTQNNKALRVVSGTAGSGGTSAFTTVFGSGKSTSGHALTQAETPLKSHTHTGSADSAGDHFHTTHTHGSDSTGFQSGSAKSTPSAGTANTNTTGAHTHTLSINNTGDATATAHSHTLSLDLQFVDLIIATKD